MEGLFKNKYRIASARLPGFDYSKDGDYSVTICVKNRKCLFGNVENKEMILNDLGQMAVQSWLDIPKHFPDCSLDEFIVMPNHVHGIIIINKQNDAVETQNFASLQHDEIYKNKFGPQSRNLSSIIRGYKAGLKKWSTMNNYEHFSWQSRFYDHVIRDEESLFNIQNYIQTNPENWERDRNNSENLWM